MAVFISGKVRTARAFDTKSGKKLLCIDITDENANVWACQMWPDDPQQQELLPHIEGMRRQSVQAEVVAPSLRMRKVSKDSNEEKPQLNLVITNVVFASAQQPVPTAG